MSEKENSNPVIWWRVVAFVNSTQTVHYLWGDGVTADEARKKAEDKVKPGWTVHQSIQWENT